MTYDAGFTNADDAYSVIVKLGDKTIQAPTHQLRRDRQRQP
ncbi:MAG TPA: hypothetical protein VM580_03620 [Labilithrix sp.]|nr:hypothetical protein [Labilithrix sp.]